MIPWIGGCDPNDFSFVSRFRQVEKKQGRSLGDKFLQLVVHPQNQIPVTCKSIKRIHSLKQINYGFIQKQKIENFFKNI